MDTSWAANIPTLYYYLSLLEYFII